MAYKLLYIEDLDPGSINSDLTSQGFDVNHLNPSKLEDVMVTFEQEKYNAVLIDFRLSGGTGKAIFDAPTVAQTIRTKATFSHSHIPIFLITAEKNISSYYDDITSNDLFDLSVSKEVFQKHLDKYCNRLKSIIKAYEITQNEKFQLDKILGISNQYLEKIDYRIAEKLNIDHFKNNTFYVARFILNQIIRSVGMLIGEDILSARLGVSLKSGGWENLKKIFEKSKYTGVFSDTYNRWWGKHVEEICEKEFGIQSLRRLNAKQRNEALTKKGVNNLVSVELLEFAESTNFWTICLEIKEPIDPIDGLELAKRDLLPWQEKEYISVLAALRSSELLKYVKPMDKERFNEIAKALK